MEEDTILTESQILLHHATESLHQTPYVSKAKIMTMVFQNKSLSFQTEHTQYNSVIHVTQCFVSSQCYLQYAHSCPYN